VPLLIKLLRFLIFIYNNQNKNTGKSVEELDKNGSIVEALEITNLLKKFLLMNF
jgi:hypothetical protein